MSTIFWLFAKSFSIVGPVLAPRSVGPNTIARFGAPILFSGRKMVLRISRLNRGYQTFLLVDYQLEERNEELQYESVVHWQLMNGLLERGEGVMRIYFHRQRFDLPQRCIPKAATN